MLIEIANETHERFGYDIFRPDLCHEMIATLRVVEDANRKKDNRASGQASLFDSEQLEELGGMELTEVFDFGPPVSDEEAERKLRQVREEMSDDDD